MNTHIITNPLKTQKNIYTFLSLFFVLIIDAMGFGIILPILPPLFLHADVGMLPSDLSIQTRDLYYGLTMAVFFVFTFFGTSYVGDLSDQLGRKKVILLCLLGVATGYLVSAMGILYKSILLLIGGRAISGFAAGSQAIAQASIIDISTPENKTRNLGMITLASCLGFVVGPMVGGYFSSILPPGLLGFSLPFFVAAGLAVLNALSVQLSFRETYKPLPKQKLQFWKALISFKSAFTYENLRSLSLAYLTMEIAWGIYFQFISLYLTKVFQYSTSKIGLFMTFLSIVFSITLTFVMRLMMKFMGLYQLILISYGLMVIGLLASACLVGEYVPWMSVVPISMGVALSYTAMMSVFSSRVDKDSQGMVMGVTSALGSLAWVISGISMGIIASDVLILPFIIGLIMILCAAFFTFIDSKKYKYE